MKSALFLTLLLCFIFVGCNPAKNASFGSLGRTPTFLNPSLTINSSSFINSANQNSFTFSGTCSGNGQNVELTEMITESPLCAFGVWSITKDLSLLGEATHTLLVNHEHSDGKKAPTITQNIIKDTIAPTLSFTAPTAGTIINNNNKANFIVNGTCGDNGQIINIFSTPSGISTTSFCSVGTWTKTINASAVADGALHIYALVSDLAGNTNLQDTGGLTKITTIPTISITLPTNGSYVNNAQQTSVNIGGTCSENGQNVTITTSPIGINSNALCSSNLWSSTLNISALPEGPITFTVNHSSSSGNTATPQSTTTIKDTVAPNVTGLVNDISPTPTKTWNWSCTETCSYRYLIDNNPTTTPTGTYNSVTTASLSDNGGTAYIHVQAQDLAGNESSISDASAIMSYTRIKGTLSGKLYEAVGLTIQNTITGEILSIDDNGIFQFSTWSGEASYNIIITNQPNHHTCTISSNTGSLPSMSAISVIISCTPHTYTIGGSITGLTTGASLTILANSNTGSTTNTITLSNEENTFTMPETRYAGRMYYLKVVSSSANVTCRLDEAKKEGVLTSNLTDANITCVPRIPGNCDNQSAELPIPNNSIRSLLCDGNDNLYLAGDFTGFLHKTGGGASFNTLDPTRFTYAPFAIPNASVRTAVSDNHGGWYIGGDFTQIGNTTRKGIAHILSDGSLNPSFNPGSLLTSANINSLVFYNSKIYVGGSFSGTLGGATRANIARIHPLTGIADSWYPSYSSSIQTLMTDGIYFYISSANAVSRVDINTAIKDATWLAQANGSIRALIKVNNFLYAGGSFSIINSQSRSNLVRISTIDATIDPTWNPSPDDHVLSLAANDENIFVGGSFATIGGQSTRSLAKISLSTGLADSTWKWSSSTYVYSLLLEGNDIYVAGSPNYSSLSKYSTTTTTLSYTISTAASYILTISKSSTELFIGGSFQASGLIQSRSRLARVSTATGKVDTWNPSPNSTVNKILFDGLSIYALGSFTDFGGDAGFKQVARIPALSGVADTTWKPQPSSTVYDILLNNNYIYIAGTFTNYLRRIPIASNTIDATWAPVLNGSTLQLAEYNSQIYVNGGFTTINGENRSGLARFNSVTGNLDSWAPSISGGGINHFNFDNNYIYIGGYFTGINSTSRPYLGRISTSDGSATPDNWPINAPNNSIYKIAIIGGNSYVSGAFNTMGATTRYNFAKVDNTSGIVDPIWNPYSNGFNSGGTSSLFDSVGTEIISSAGSASRPYLVKISTTGSGTYPY